MTKTKEEIAEEAAHLITITDMEFNADVNISEKLRIKESVKYRVLASLKELEEQHKSSKVGNTDATDSELHEETGEVSTIVTDSLGFRLEVEITIGDLEPRGHHRTLEDENGRVVPVAPHKIKLSYELKDGELAEVAAHEAYHLFYSVRHLITADEETQAEVFGHLVKRIYESATATKGKEDSGLPRATGVESASQTCLLPMPEGLDFRNGGEHCDMIIGPCSCGAWHKIEDLPWRIFNQLRASLPHDTTQKEAEVGLSQQSVESQPHEETGDAS